VTTVGQDNAPKSYREWDLSESEDSSVEHGSPSHGELYCIHQTPVSSTALPRMVSCTVYTRHSSINVSTERLKWRPMPDKNAGINVTP